MKSVINYLSIAIMVTSFSVSAATQKDLYIHVKEISGLDTKRYAIGYQYLYQYFSFCEKYNTADIDYFMKTKAFKDIYTNYKNEQINVNLIMSKLDAHKEKIQCEGK